MLGLLSTLVEHFDADAYTSSVGHCRSPASGSLDINYSLISLSIVFFFPTSLPSSILKHLVREGVNETNAYYTLASNISAATLREGYLGIIL